MTTSTGPDSPQGDSAAVTTSTEGSERGSNALGPAPGVVPPMCLLPAGTFGWPNPVVAIRYLDGSELPWRCSNGARLTDSQVSGFQRLVPVEPLLALVERWRQARNMHREHALTLHEDDDRPGADDDVLALEYELRAAELGRLLNALLGEDRTGDGP